MTSDYTINRPKVLLIGVGSFGANYLRLLNELHANKKITLVGVVVKTNKHAIKLKKDYNINTFTDYQSELLKSVDSVFVVTPPETHFKIVQDCLQYANVFVEKPMALSSEKAEILRKMAKEHNRVLMVGHIFRFHPVTRKLKEIIKKRGVPKHLEGCFINPLETDKGRTIPLELLHLFDLVDYLWKPKVQSVFSSNIARIISIDIRYKEFCDFKCKIGWFGKEKNRNLKIFYDNLVIEADFVNNKIAVTKGNTSHTYMSSENKEPLLEEINIFLGQTKQMVTPEVAIRVIEIAERSISHTKRRPSVAIIGGGIFGTNIALELSSFCKVTLFEKNSELMQEGTRVNQFRHHYGYHYPRSDETVFDIQRSLKDFESIYEPAIIRDTPTYYAIAKRGSLVTGKEFISFCEKHNLPYKIDSVDAFASDMIDVCIKVPEPSYNYEKISKITKSKLSSKAKNIKVKCNHYVKDMVISEYGEKELTVVNNDKILVEKYDFVINATYAFINEFTDIGKFETVPIRIDATEVLIITIPISPISLTVMDGPFATLMPTGNPNEFTLYHAKESILNRYTPKDGLIVKENTISNREMILNESMKLFPILKKAKIIESRFLHRGVMAKHESDDSRVADIIPHGFGCWSILSGKIVSSASIAKKVSEIIHKSII